MVSIGALSAQYSNLVAADSKLAAQCGASVKARDEATATSDAFLRDGSGSQCTLTRTSLARTCGCAGCPSVSPMRTLRVPHAGPDVDVVDTVPSGVPDSQTQHSSLQHATLHAHCQLGRLLHVAPSCKAHASTHSTPVSTKSTRCEHSQHPIWVPLPVRVLRVFMRASKEPHAGIHSIHESTRSILSDHLQYPCECSEYRM